MWMKNQLLDRFRRVGVQSRDVVLVHSALRRLGPVEGGADTVIDALLEAAGPEGTVAVPTHTFAVVNAKQPVFHQTLTPSNVGTLTNVFRARPDAIRGLHPTHSVAAIGRRAAELVDGHERDETPCSPTSPYGRLREWGGKVLLVGVGLEACTFFHGCEEWARMPFACSKESIRLYSITSDCTVIPVNHHYHYVNTWDQYPRLEPGLLDAGMLRVDRIGDCPIRLLDAQPAADWVIRRLKDDPSIALPDGFSLEDRHE